MKKDAVNRIALLLTGAVAVVHLALANRYSLFGDELYFIACGRHPAFGYADQPPLVPLLSALLYSLGSHVWLLRLPSVAAASGLVWLTISMSRLLGGSQIAALISGLGAACAPMLMSITAVLWTSTFEPLAWTAVAYAVTRTVILDDRRALLWGGLVLGLALEAKYAIPIWLVALTTGLLVTGERRILGVRELWIGLLIAAILTAPSLLWQATHGWPFIDLMKAAARKNLVLSPGEFLVRLMWSMNITLAPLWIAGAIAPFLMQSLTRVRFLAIGFLSVLIAVMFVHGKDYYVAAAFPTAFAVGSVALERVLTSTRLRVACYVTVLVATAITAPLALPILSPEDLVQYEKRMDMSVPRQLSFEARGDLPIVFGFQFGWQDFVRQVADAYHRVPASERQLTAILVEDYGEAGAIDLYGPAYGLPTALSGHNQYFLWGMRDQTPRNVLYLTGSDVWPATKLHPRGTECETLTVMGKTHSAYAMAFENGKTIALCTGMHPDLATIWPSLRFIF